MTGQVVGFFEAGSSSGSKTVTLTPCLALGICMAWGAEGEGL